MKTAVRFAVILAFTVALISLLYWLRPKPGGASTEAPQQPAATDEGAKPGAAAAPVETNADVSADLPEVIPLPLAPIAIEAENGMWRTNGDYQIIPHGTQSLGGIEFVFDAMLQLQSTSSEAFQRSYRTNIDLHLAEAGVAQGRFGSLHLICGNRWWAQPESRVADLVWHYADKQSRSVPIVHLQHVREWVRPPYEEPPHLPYKFTKVVWHSPTVAESGRWQRLYRLTLPNPEPNRDVAGAELVSSRSEATLIVLAATLDRLPPGGRADDSPDLEPTDIAPPEMLQVLIQDRRATPVAAAQLRVQTYPTSAAAPASSRYFTSDQGGAVTVLYPPTNLRRLELSASHDDYGSRRMAWDIQGGDTVPATYTFKLAEAVTIGGLVVNKNSEPVPEASLRFFRYWSGGERPDAKGEQPEFSTRTVTTDAAGAWQLKGVPAELLAHIGFQLTHADYPATNMTFRGDDEIEKQLRAGTFKTVLASGLIVAGRVLDQADNPIADATVWSGRRYFPNRQKTTTDAAGKFTFRNLEEGDALLSFAADGYKAESKTLAVSNGMSEILVRLKPGHSIRGVVQDESGQPVSGVRVVLEDTRQPRMNEGIEFSTTTGDYGKFEWKSAPNEPKAFYIGKQGYEQLRNKVLDVDVDNVVTLLKPRQVEGYVLDADAGQPVTKFQVTPGRTFNSPGLPLVADNFFRNGQTKDFSDSNGRFTLELDDQDQNAVQVQAKDYAAKVQQVSADLRTLRLEFRLKPSASLQGIVVSQDGQPQPGAQVALTQPGVGPGSRIHLRQGRLENYGNPSRIVTTDGNGAFSLDSPPETGGRVFAAGDNGYGSASVDEVRASGRVVLQDFGQIEGTFTVAGTPSAGQDLYFTLSGSGIDTDFTGFKVSTDSDGKFKFTKLPAGDGEVVRLVRTSPNSWMHSHKTNVTVVAGQTTYLALGDSGALLRGTARLLAPSPDDGKLILSGFLRGAGPTMPNFASADQAKAFMQSAEWQAQMRAQQSFGVVVGADGTFTVDSVPPGSYRLTINATQSSTGGPPGASIASGTLEVTVPDNPDPMTPIQIGEVVLLNQTNQPQRYSGP
jgi:hypothetical protein